MIPNLFFPDLVEPVVLNPISLSELFNVRAVFAVVDADDERLSPSYWLANPATEEPDLEPDLVHCNMADIIAKYCQDFNLEEELQKGTVPTADELTRPRRQKYVNLFLVASCKANNHEMEYRLERQFQLVEEWDFFVPHSQFT